VTATGVLVITPESAGRWVGPHPAAVILLRTMREVRNLDTIKVANCSGGTLSYSLDAEVVAMPKAETPAAAFASAVATAADGAVVCCYAATPLLSAAAIERCGATLGRAVVVAQTVVEARGFALTDGCWSEFDVPVAVRGVVAMHPTVRSEFPYKTKPSQIRFVPVSRKEALSLAEPDDLEVIQALEYSGRI